MIGLLLRYLRTLAGLSHYDLARLSNATVPQAHVAEADRSNEPELLLALLYTLGIDPDPPLIDTVRAHADRDDPRYLGGCPPLWIWPRSAGRSATSRRSSTP